MASAASISPASTSASASAVAMNGMKLSNPCSRQVAIASAHFRETGTRVVQMPTARPWPQETAVGRPRWHCVSREKVDESLDMRRRSGGFRRTSEHGDVEMPIDGGADVVDFRRARHHFLVDPARPIDLAKRPKDQGQVGRYGNAEVLGKTKGKIAIALRIKDRERASRAKPAPSAKFPQTSP